MAREIQPPTPLTLASNERSVFLAGSIDMGAAGDWQREVCEALKDTDLTILNPRRDAWDSSWEQSIENPTFREQVEWELDGQEQASMIAMYFHPGTQAPITLMELGLFARTGKVVVCCPDGYWRKGNVEVVCCRHKIPMVATLESLMEAIRVR